MRKTTNLRPYLLLLSVFIFFQNVQATDTKVYKFAVNSPGAPPYLYILPETNTYVGLINDIVNEVSRTHGVKFKFIDSNRKRNEPLINEGKIDAFLLSKVWLKHPEKIITTIPLFKHRMFLYQMQPFEDSFNVTNLENDRVCTRDSYIYPSLTDMFEKGLIDRIDSRSQVSIVSMLVAGRCDYAIMNEFNAMKVVNSSDFKKYKIYISPNPSDETHVEIILRPELTQLKSQLDQTIAAMNQDGRLKSSLLSHVK